MVNGLAISLAKGLLAFQVILTFSICLLVSIASSRILIELIEACIAFVFAICIYEKY